MDIFAGILYGFGVSLQHLNLLYCFLGVFVGTLVGVLPGIGPSGAMAILLPLTFGLPPATAIIMLAGIYYGVMYGGSTTSILVNIPGEPSSVVTCLDGYQMAKKGRAGPALGTAAFGSFIGGTFSLIALTFLAIPLAEAALKFGPPEYVALICVSMTLLTYLARGSTVKAVIMILFGLILSCVGLDLVSGMPRFVFGSPSLLDGIGFVPLTMGLFGISEVLKNLQKPSEKFILESRIKNLLPNLQDWRKSIGPITRGSFIGFFLGILPGGGGVLSSFVSYTVEKKLSRNPEAFGQGAIEGVAGPETSNNAGAGGAFVPLLALGIPPNVVMAFLLGALIIHGVAPGPTLIGQHPQIFWGVIASMYLGNIMLLFLNLPLIGLWVKVLKVPYRVLMPLILLFCFIGAYSINNSVSDVIIMIVFGVVGYILRRFDYEEAPLVMAFILGPMLEAAFRQSLIMSDGKFSIFLTRPISAVALVISALLFISSGFSYYRKARSGARSHGSRLGQGQNPGVYSNTQKGGEPISGA
ncbi:MAG: tripartite tricarboxylate transporter permease [Thermodesulfobacteriota bacterium]